LLPLFATGVNDTSGKFAAGIVDTGGKFAAGINNASENGGKIKYLVANATLVDFLIHRFVMRRVHFT
jgi:hypothetical protein